jgi:hypothetical protein
MTVNEKIMNMVSIKIRNPAWVASRFGDMAGDYTVSECQWWVGNPHELYPAAVAKGKVINAPVRFCGGGAWIHSRRDGWTGRGTGRPVRGQLTSMPRRQLFLDMFTWQPRLVSDRRHRLQFIRDFGPMGWLP